MQSSDMTSRRSFLKTLAVTGAAVVAAPLVLGGSPAIADGGEKVGAVGDFTAGTPKKVTLASGASIYILKKADGTFLALSSRCTHRGCEILWVPANTYYECPCHHGRFSTTGAVLNGPPQDPLPSYPCKVSGGSVFVTA
jgi:Rieske Fe-S protein